MITVRLVRSMQQWEAFEVMGHAGYADAGEPDIVCAAVSSLAIAIENGLDQVAQVTPLLVEQDEENGGYLYVALPEQLSDTQRQASDVLLQTFAVAIENIASSYPEHIQVQYEDRR